MPSHLTGSPSAAVMAAAPSVQRLTAAWEALRLSPPGACHAECRARTGQENARYCAGHEAMSIPTPAASEASVSDTIVRYEPTHRRCGKVIGKPEDTAEAVQAKVDDEAYGNMCPRCHEYLDDGVDAIERRFPVSPTPAAASPSAPAPSLASPDAGEGGALVNCDWCDGSGEGPPAAGSDGPVYPRCSGCRGTGKVRPEDQPPTDPRLDIPAIRARQLHGGVWSPRELQMKADIQALLGQLDAETAQVERLALANNEVHALLSAATTRANEAERERDGAREDEASTAATLARVMGEKAEYADFARTNGVRVHRLTKDRDTLAARVSVLEAALRPFAGANMDGHPDDAVIVYEGDPVTAAHFRRATAAMKVSR